MTAPLQMDGLTSTVAIAGNNLDLRVSGIAGAIHYDVAYATCQDDTDRRFLAEAFEMMGGERQIEHARRIYRQLGDRDKYLELRNRKIVYGGDFYALASFYWEAGEKTRAMQVAE